MMTLLFLIMGAVCVFISIRRPEWFWTTIIGSSALLQLAAVVLHQDPNSIAVGPISARSTDPALLGVLAGTMYHARREDSHDHDAEGFRFLTQRPVGMLVLLMLSFMAIKVIASVLFRNEDIMATRVVSHAAGGVVAAVGDMRDELLPFLPIMYAYASPRSRRLGSLGWPMVTLVGILLFKAACALAAPGIFLGPAPDVVPRFIPAEDAITLTLVGFLLLFLPVKRLGRRVSITLGLLALGVATLADHRSQWLAVAAGAAVLVLVVIFGPPIVQNAKLIRVSMAAVLLVGTVTVMLAMTASEDRGGLPFVPDFLVKRLYAFTDPSRDPDSEWRQRLWKSRIEGVGDDWPWGRPFGARADTLMNGRWTSVPAHSGYVSIYEVGGVALCVLAMLFWIRLAQLAVLRLLRQRRGEPLWPALIVLTTIAASLAYGTAYLFPLMGPTLAVMLILAGGSSSPAVFPAGAGTSEEKCMLVGTSGNKMEAVRP